MYEAVYITAECHKECESIRLGWFHEGPAKRFANVQMGFQIISTFDSVVS